MGRLFAVALCLVAIACGGSTESDSGPTGGTSGADAGLGATGGAGGSGGTTASGGTGAVGGIAGSGAVSGTGGTPTNCIGLSYCDCVPTNGSCQVFAEDCFCPCGIEPCEPSCDCDCGGGKYLGCGPSNIMQPGALEGIWLVGWSGGMEHYSWVRFNADFTADILAGTDLPTNAPIWNCSGKGSWLFSAKLYNVSLTLPAPCEPGLFDLTFEKLLAPETTYMKGAILRAHITKPPLDTPLEGFKFPDTQCDTAMTACTSPY